ncbi:MAG: mechanosensitive ion channel family protein [Blautia sp.]|nr:mechanosensitive ion channel family protein [Blautia sp.]
MMAWLSGTEEVLLDELRKNPGVIRAYLEGLVPSLLAFLLQLALAIIVLFIGSRIVKAIVRMVEKSMQKGHAEAGVITFLCSLIRYSLYFVLVMLILSGFGVTTSSVVAVLGSAGLTLGLALQGSLSNFAGGVLIMLLKPFVVGDYISDSGSGKEGTVAEITTFYTKLLSADNKVIIIPNGNLSNDCITNYTSMKKRRVDILVGVDYRTNLAEAKRVLLGVVEKEPGVLSGEPVDIFVDALAESSVNLGVRVWVGTDDYWHTRWRLLENIKNALDENGILIPFPQLDVRLRGD